MVLIVADPDAVVLAVDAAGAGTGGQHGEQEKDELFHAIPG